jgi:hypothetical protein
MQTFSLNALAESFEVDRSRMVLAMRGVTPDLVKSGNRPTWKTATAARALEAHRCKKYNGGNGGGQTNQVTDQLEADFKRSALVLPSLKPSPKRRRKLDERLGVGKMIGGLDRRMKEANAALSEGHGLLQFACDYMIGSMISNYLTLVDYWPDDAGMESLWAKSARRAARA